MCRALLIDDEETCNLAAELASLTGESITTVVATALQEEIARERARQKRHDRIMAITREIAVSAQYGLQFTPAETAPRGAWTSAPAR
ncbi:MAG TPA: type II toxin-antitoxin system VapB family antitoxin [Acetobacteraceae bacterium]|nr:type II toxin-antitoxin system VapB family antitoxin [Acetobacteraceae bacterium]